MTRESTRPRVNVDSTDRPKSVDNINWKLLQACTVRHLLIAREALFQGADINCRRSDFLTPLHIAVEHDDIELIQLLCDQPFINIDSKTLHGLTPLHKAALLGHTNAIKKLLENGATVNCTDNLNRYPLHYAALRKDVESAMVLLINGANINVYDVFHESPLYTSVIRRPFFPMIKLLLSHGAIVSSASHQNSLGLLLEAVLSIRNVSDMNILDLLFQNGADVNTTDFVGLRTPLHIAAITGNLKLATYLIEKGADLHRKNCMGQTPMELALIHRNLKIAQLIENSFSKKLKLHRTASMASLINI